MGKKRNITHFWGVLLTCILVVLVVVNNYYEVFPVHLFSVGSQGRSIRLLSYNVHSEAIGFESSSPKMAKMIMDVNPDFVYLTEYYEGTGETLHHQLSQQYPFVDRKHSWGENEGDAFYSKWEIDSVMRFSILWHYSTIFRVQIHHKTDTMAIYCCHLSSNNQILESGRWDSMEEGRRLRCEEADIIVDALQNERHPAIVMGDMNDVSGSYAMRRLESAGLSDAWWKGGLGYGSTYSEDWLKLRIDHILYDKKKLKLQFVDVIGDYKYSDHRAVVAELEWRGK